MNTIPFQIFSKVYKNIQKFILLFVALFCFSTTNAQQVGDRISVGSVGDVAYHLQNNPSNFIIDGNNYDITITHQTGDYIFGYLDDYVNSEFWVSKNANHLEGYIILAWNSAFVVEVNGNNVGLVKTPKNDIVRFNANPTFNEINLVNTYHKDLTNMFPEMIYVPNIPYTAELNEAQAIDLYLPGTRTNYPVVVYYHAGGFVDGSRKSINSGNTIQEYLNRGIAVISAGYRLLEADSLETDGVIKPLMDSRTALDFIIENHNLLHVDLNRLGIAGSSAGAGIAVWLNVTENSTLNQNLHRKIKAIYAHVPQVSYDLSRWKEELGDDFVAVRSVDSSYYDRIYGGRTPEFMESEAGSIYRNKIDMIAHLDSDDSPMYLSSEASSQNTNFGVFLHSCLHSTAIARNAQRAKHFKTTIKASPCDINDTYDENEYDWMSRHLKEIYYPPANENIRSIPGYLTAKDHDIGGYGKSYKFWNTADESDEHLIFNVNEGVTTYIEYTLNANQTGTYTIIPSGAISNADLEVQVFIDGKLTGLMTAPFFNNVNVKFAKGQHQLKYVFKTSTTNKITLQGLNYSLISTTRKKTSVPQSGISIGEPIKSTDEVKTSLVSAINLYPNPASDFVNIELNGGTDVSGFLTIVGMDGNVYLRSEIIGNQKQRLSLGGLPVGVYQVIYQNNHEVRYTEFVKNR